MQNKIITLGVLFLSSAVAMQAAVIVESFTGGTDNATVAGYTNTNASDLFTYNDIGGTTYLDSSNNGLNASYKDMTSGQAAEFSNLASFTMDYVILTSPGELQFGLASQSDLNGGSYSATNTLIGINIKNNVINLVRPNDAGTAQEVVAVNLQDPANNSRVNVRLDVDVVAETVDVFYKTEAAGAFTQVGTDIDLQWDFASAADIGRWWGATRAGTGLESLTVTTTAIPEPSTIMLLGLGMGSLCLLRRGQKT